MVRMFAVWYIKNTMLLGVMLAVVLNFVNTAFAELQRFAAYYEAAPDNVKVIIVLGLLVVPAILTKLEMDTLDSIMGVDRGFKDSEE